MDEDAGQPLGEVLSYAKTTLQKLHLQGNKMRGGGLSGILSGMDHNNKLEYLSLADNAIAATDEDTEALEKLAGVMQRGNACCRKSTCSTTALEKRARTPCSRPLMEELEGSKGRRARSERRQADHTRPDQLFKTLSRLDAGPGKKAERRAASAVRL